LPLQTTVAATPHAAPTLGWLGLLALAFGTMIVVVAGKRLPFARTGR